MDEQELKARIEELERELERLKKRQTFIEKRHIRVQYSRDNGMPKYMIRITDRVSEIGKRIGLSRFKTIAHRQNASEVIELLKAWSDDALEVARCIEQGELP